MKFSVPLITAALATCLSGAVAADCGSLTTPKSCDSADGCSWCKSAAIPSKCYKSSDAKRLPPGVFTCDSVEQFEDPSMFLDEHSPRLVELSNSDKGGICDPNVKQSAGYFRLQKQNKYYFYWFFESRHDPIVDPVVLWMTGGPGCSSEVALFGENGPCKVNADGTETTLNPYSWNNNASLIYIDQPAGTGFSHGTHDTDEVGVAQDMYEFLTEFFGYYKKFDQNPFYVFGESYGGHYVPATSHRVWLGNKNKESPVHINLKGVAVGNGLTDPEIQYKYYPDMAYNSTTTPSRISKAEYLLMKKIAVPVCIKMIKACNDPKSGSVETCAKAMESCNLSLVNPVMMAGWNPYDIREQCAVKPLCYDFSGVAKYLARDDVRKFLGVDGGKEWESCDKGVTVGFMGDWMKNYQNQIPELLEDGIPVMIYAGDADFICNWIGNKAWTLELEWAGKEGFQGAADKDWVTSDGKTSGKVRSYKGFTFLQVYGAGHMVPLDKPLPALDMLNAFISKKKTTETSTAVIHDEELAEVM